MAYFDEVKKNFGFGCMRLPMNGEEVDFAQFSKMIDVFMENGFNYFDTAHMYIKGKSEPAIKECLAKRYPRDKYILTDKLSNSCFETEDEIRPLLEKQLKACGVEYFDFYLMHAQNAALFEKYKKCHAYETALELKAEGKIRHLGISFHDSAEVLDQILTEYPQIEVVQIQFNYLDYEDLKVQSKKCYEVCRKHDKPVIIMEPVKGGGLVNLPEDAISEFKKVGKGSPASYAIRFAASFDGVFMVLSGMSDMEQMNDNISYMKDFVPLNEDEMKAVEKVRNILIKENVIQCTNCRYCVDGCPQKILIPDLISCYNVKSQQKQCSADDDYREYTKENGKASDCIKCGKCEKICPQHLEIIKIMQRVARSF